MERVGAPPPLCLSRARSRLSRASPAAGMFVRAPNTRPEQSRRKLAPNSAKMAPNSAPARRSAPSHTHADYTNMAAERRRGNDPSPPNQVQTLRGPSEVR